MELSLSDTARLLGKSLRRVRYLIQQGELKAKKSRGRWVVLRGDLPLNEAQVSRGLAEHARLKEVVESALGTAEGANPRRRYSVTDLMAFEAGRKILVEVRGLLGEQAPATRRIGEALSLITCGCHTFHKRDKISFYQRAREQICYGLSELLVSSQEQAASLASSIEGEWLPFVGSIIRATERRRA